MRWYIPSWNGDVRAERDPDDPKKTRLVIVQPTESELKMLDVLGAELFKKGLVTGPELWHTPNGGPYREGEAQTVLVNTTVEKVGARIAKIMKAGRQTMTAFVLKDGSISTVAGTGPELDAVAAAVAKGEKSAITKVGDKAKEIVKDTTEAVAATVKRPTPSCPQCYPDAIGPATEVLLEFMTPEQHEDWKDHRALVAVGASSGHRYILAHRHSALASRFGKICFDADDRVVLHFHDWSVPPEEEVLAAKLILEHREGWLRNEATVLGASVDWHLGLQVSHQIPWHTRRDKYKNPFGGGGDGVADSLFTNEVGQAALGFLWGFGKATGAIP